MGGWFSSSNSNKEENNLLINKDRSNGSSTININNESSRSRKINKRTDIPVLIGMVCF